MAQIHSSENPLCRSNGHTYGVWQLTHRQDVDYWIKTQYHLLAKCIDMQWTLEIFLLAFGCEGRKRISNGWEDGSCYCTLLVSALMWACVSLRREMELLLRPPTTAISVLKFCNWSSFCQREGGNIRSEGERGDTKGMCKAMPKRILRSGRERLKRYQNEKDAGKKSESCVR